MQIFVVYDSRHFRLISEYGQGETMAKEEAHDFHRTFTLDVEENTPIGDVLLQLSQKTGFPDTQIRLLYRGKLVQELGGNRNTLADYDIGREATLQWVPRLRGD